MANKAINAFVDGTNGTRVAWTPGAHRQRTQGNYISWDDTNPETWDSSYPHTWDDWQTDGFSISGTRKTRNAKP